MTVWLIFVVLPVALIVLSFRIRPLRDASGDVLGAGLAARGVFGDHGLKPDERSVREDTEARPFWLEEGLICADEKTPDFHARSPDRA